MMLFMVQNKDYDIKNKMNVNITNVTLAAILLYIKQFISLLSEAVAFLCCCESEITWDLMSVNASANEG